MVAAITLIISSCPAKAMANGWHDFDFEIGTWNIRVRRLQHPLTGSRVWIEPHGYVHIVRPVLGGDATLAQLEALQPAPHYIGLMLRLYDAGSQTWRVYWGSRSTGKLDAPLIGSFRNGCGTLIGHQTFEGRPVLVRIVYSRVKRSSFHTEQAFSTNGGRSWETNLVQDFSRVRATVIAVSKAHWTRP